MPKAEPVKNSTPSQKPTPARAARAMRMLALLRAGLGFTTMKHQRTGNQFAIWLAWKLPRKLVYWCAVRVMTPLTHPPFDRAPAPPCFRIFVAGKTRPGLVVSVAFGDQDCALLHLLRIKRHGDTIGVMSMRGLRRTHILWSIGLGLRSTANSRRK